MASIDHPDDGDFYVSPTGTVTQQPHPLAAAALKLNGWHGPSTLAIAQTLVDRCTGHGPFLLNGLVDRGSAAAAV